MMEIYGIGTDIIEISRIETSINRTKTFKEKVYTKNEIEHIEKKRNPYASYAGRFAAKEAVSKALGTGVRNFSLRDIEILNDELGKPNIILYNNLKDFMKNLIDLASYTGIHYDQANFYFDQANAVMEELLKEK